MKTKISKRLLSILLAALMVITSVPLMSITALADSNAIDEALAEVETAMASFEDLLAVDGALYSNVSPAYEAYVACQKAVDAYTYGGETNALDGVAEALENAISEIEEFTGKTGTAIPTFPTSTESDMQGYAGSAYNNVLYAPQATVQSVTSSDVGGVVHRTYYATDAVLLYDGVNDTILPVLMSAALGTSGDGYNKTRYIWSGYPSDSSGNDYGDWAFEQNWASGNGNDANWNWNWWAGNWGGPGGQVSSYGYAAYNNATGVVGTYSTSVRSGALPSQSRSGNIFSGYTYTEGSQVYMANALKLEVAPTGTSADYTPYWYITTGGDNNNDYSITQATSAIHVVNYKSLTDALSTNGEKMKTIDLADYSEGGLADYFAAMDAATSWDPNTYFTDGNGYDTCVSDMEALISDMNNASTTLTDSDSYATLRSAMSSAVRTVYAAGNVNDDESLKYTEDSWAAFAEAYEAAQTVMADVNDNGYISEECETLATTLTEAYKALVYKALVVDTTELEALIDAFESYADIFTDETYANALEVIAAAKTAVWGSEDNYGVAADALALTDDNQQIVDDQVTLVQNAIYALRISPDAVLMTSYGRYSLNTAIDLQENVKDNQSDYSNYSTFATAISNANELIYDMANDDLTDYDTQYANYIAAIEAVVEAYNSLEKSFTAIDDGTIAQQGKTTTMKALTGSDKGKQSVEFAYTRSAIIFKTNHEDSDYVYGSGDITFGCNIQSRNTNMLDSITLNATADEINGQDGKNHINSNSAVSNVKPTALTDDEKATYAGCTSYGNISLENIRYTGTTDNNETSYILTTSDGTQVTDEDTAMAMDLTDIIGTTDGVSANPAYGGVFVKSSDGEFAYSYLTSDLTVSVSGSEEIEDLAVTDVPTSTDYKVSGTNFGAVTVHNCQNTTLFAMYNWYTSASTGETIQTTATVIDISYLVDLVSQCNELLDDAAMYTDDSWSTFTSALESAQSNLNYTLLTAAQITTQCQNRYTTLWNARNDLVVKTLDVTFSYKDADGNDTSTVLGVTYGETLSADDVAAIDVPDYVLDGYTYTFAGWDSEVSYDAVVRDVTYTATYTSSLNQADWTAYNTARATLIGLLTDYTYTADSLTAVANALAEQTSFFDYSDEAKEATMADMQTDIDTETTTLEDIVSLLVSTDIDYSAAVAAIAAIKAAYDEDAYDVSVLDFAYTESVDIFSGDTADITVIGYTYDSQSALDAAIEAAVESLNSLMTYTVYLNGTAVGTYEYGETATINSEDGSDVAWTYSYAAPSNEYTQSIEKYMGISASLEFIVKGNTYLTTTATESTDEDCYVVKFVANLGGNQTRTFAIEYVTDGEVTMPQFPTYAYYTPSSTYTTGEAVGDTVTITADTTFVLYYSVNTSDTYTIDFFDTLDSFCGIYNKGISSSSECCTEEYIVSYNELVELESADAYCWTINTHYGEEGVDTYRIIAYGTSYSFYACESYTIEDVDADGLAIVAMTYEEYADTITSATNTESSDPNYGGLDDEATDYLVDSLGNPILLVSKDGLYYTEMPDLTPDVSALEDTVIPIYDEDGNNSKFSMIGTFTLPDGYTLVECGFLFTNTAGADLTIENVGTDGVARMKSSQYTCGNQFVINVKYSGTDYSFKYKPYLIAKDSSGNLVTYYGKESSMLNTADVYA